MGALVELQSGRVIPLGPRVVIGRSPNADLRIRSRLASNEHAVLYWDDHRWKVRDLGSRNGTVVDDQAVGREPCALSRGSVVRIGPENAWSLTDTSPPTVFARHPSGRSISGVDGMLGLPEDDPTVFVFEAASGHWLLETEAGTTVVEGTMVLPVRDVSYQLTVPTTSESTWTADSREWHLSMVRLVFRVSADEEHVEIEVAHGELRKSLGARVHHYMLLTLARAWMEDEHTSEAERGWRYATDVSRMLGVTERALNMQVFRARQQLAAQAVAGAASVIERRPGTGQLRIGTGQVEIDQP